MHPQTKPANFAWLTLLTLLRFHLDKHLSWSLFPILYSSVIRHETLVLPQMDQTPPQNIQRAAGETHVIHQLFLWHTAGRGRTSATHCLLAPAQALWLTRHAGGRTRRLPSVIDTRPPRRGAQARWKSHKCHSPLPSRPVPSHRRPFQSARLLPSLRGGGCGGQTSISPGPWPFGCPPVTSAGFPEEPTPIWARGESSNGPLSAAELQTWGTLGAGVGVEGGGGGCRVSTEGHKEPDTFAALRGLT